MLLLREMQKAVYEGSPFDIFCIGTPRIIGDSVGPLIGTALLQYDFPFDVKIIGTVAKPIVSANYEQRLKELRPDTYVIAVDATVGRSIGTWDVYLGSIKPGAGVNKDLPSVGHASIKCYTAINSLDLLMVKKEMVHRLVTEITTVLTDLLHGEKKGIYREINK